MKKGVCLLVLVSLFLALQTFPQVFTEENMEYVYPTIETTGIQLNATAYRLQSGDTINLTFSFTNNEYVKYTLLQYYNHYGESEEEAYVNATFYRDGVYGGYSYSDIGPGSSGGRSLSKSISFLLPGNHTIEWKWLFKVEENGPGHFDVDFYGVKLILQMVLTATVDIDPATLNLKSKGKWITCYVELPEGYNPSSINRTTVLLDYYMFMHGKISVASFWVDKPLESVVGDYDNDGIPDLMVKFDRSSVIEYLLSRYRLYGNVTWKVTGELNDGTLFEGSDTFRVKMHIKPPRGKEVRIVSVTHNILPDGKIEITAVTENCRSCRLNYDSYFGSHMGGGGSMRFVGDGTYVDEIGPFLDGTEVSYIVSAIGDNQTLVVSDVYTVQIGKVERSNITTLTISNVHHSPQNPTTNDSRITVTADVTSNVTVSSVEFLHWRYFLYMGQYGSGGGSGSMMKKDEYTYESWIDTRQDEDDTIDTYSEGTIVFYKVVAKDESNNTAVSPVFNFTILPEAIVNSTLDFAVENYMKTNPSLSSNEIPVEVTENEQIAIALEDFTIPEFPTFLILPLFVIATLLAVIVYRRKHSM